MILDIEFETPCGSVIKVDLRVKNDGAKVTIQDAEIVSVAGNSCEVCQEWSQSIMARLRLENVN